MPNEKLGVGAGYVTLRHRSVTRATAGSKPGESCSRGRINPFRSDMTVMAQAAVAPQPRPSTPTTSSSNTVSASEVLASLSQALDLTEGQPLGHSVRSCMIGMRLGQEVGLNDEQLAELYYALLLKDAGCSSNAAKIASLFGSDDQAVKPRMKIVDWDDRMRLAVETWRTTGLQLSLGARMKHFVGVARQENLTKDMIAARCERGADIARRLGFPEGTVSAIRSLDEHWNGQGYPAGQRGDDIPLMSRILNLAQTVEVFWGSQGPDAADTMLRDRRGRWFDPRLTDLVLGWMRDAPFWETLQGDEVAHRVLQLEPSRLVRRVDEHGLDTIAQAFADIIDAKSPFTYRHSSQVAMYVCAIGAEMGFDAATMVQMRRAGLLHDNLLAFLRDLGVGLEIGLYEEFVMHLFGGKEQVERDVQVEIGGHRVGEQRMRLIAPGVAFKITGLDRSLDDFETHARRLLAHADLRAIAWININMKCVTFTTLTK